ncbi:hypothetical protein M569_08827, partial [Genlisea aurea]
QIPAFGDWDRSYELPITQYFECARQAGLLHCTCSRAMHPQQRPPPPPPHHHHHLHRDRGRFIAKQLLRRGRHHNHKRAAAVLPKSAVVVVDEDLYKISPALLNGSTKRRMLGFLSRCMAPPC